VKHPLAGLLTVTVFLMLSGVFLMLEKTCVYAGVGNEAVEGRVADILFEESAGGKIKVVVLDFNISLVPSGKKLSENELKGIKTRYTEEFIAGIIGKIKDSGKRDNISIIDNAKLEDILREKQLPATAITERTVTELGRVAGVDVIITGRIQVDSDSETATAKVIRVKDGEILDIVKQDKREKPSVVHATVTILDTIEKLKIGSYKALPLTLPSGGTLNVTVDVVRGNPIDVTLIPGSELENYKTQKEVKNVALFTATKKKSYKRSANLNNGDYYLIIRDSSLGVFSVQHSEIKITAQLER